MNRTPYVYRIKNKITGHFYYGCKYAKKCSPDTFWKDYFTSSETIAEMLIEYPPELWDTKIIKIGRTPAEVLSFEGKLIKRTIKSKMSLNFRYQETYCGMNDIIVAKMLKKRNTPNEEGITSYQIGTTKMLETKKNTILENGLTINQQASIKTADTRRERGDFDKLSQEILDKGGICTERKICEYCSAEITLGNYVRWHGENCKMNPNIDLEKLLEIRSCGKGRSKTENEKLANSLSHKDVVSAFCLDTCKNIKIKKEEFDKYKGIKYVGQTHKLAIELRNKNKGEKCKMN